MGKVVWDDADRTFTANMGILDTEKFQEIEKLEKYFRTLFPKNNVMVCNQSNIHYGAYAHRTANSYTKIYFNGKRGRYLICFHGKLNDLEKKEVEEYIIERI